MKNGRKYLGLAVMAFAAVAAVGCSSSEEGTRAGLGAQSEFQEQAELLLQKNALKADELRNYEYFSQGRGAANLEYAVTGEAGKGIAVLNCSSYETLAMGTQCIIGSLKFLEVAP